MTCMVSLKDLRDGVKPDGPICSQTLCAGMRQSDVYESKSSPSHRMEVLLTCE